MMTAATRAMMVAKPANDHRNSIESYDGEEEEDGDEHVLGHDRGGEEDFDHGIDLAA